MLIAYNISNSNNNIHFQGVCETQKMLNRCHTGFSIINPVKLLLRKGQLVNSLSIVTLDLVSAF